VGYRGLLALEKALSKSSGGQKMVIAASAAEEDERKEKAEAWVWGLLRESDEVAFSSVPAEVKMFKESLIRMYNGNTR
jgi:hypothetical protein